VPAKLLVADDSTTIQKVFEKTFLPEEFTLRFANNGEEALAKARAERPQVIIADINMPLKNGFELCEEIKKDQALQGIPVLLLIGILDDFDENESRRVGADGFIVKPFEANAAINKVRAALAKGGSTLPTGTPTGAGEEEILELADIIKEPPATPSSLPQNKREEFILDTPLRELETELKAEFPEEKAEDKEALPLQEEKKEESWSLDLDLPLDEMEPEPQTKDAEWTRVFRDVGVGGSGQEVNGERLGTILDESTTELERIEGLGLKRDTPKDGEEVFAEQFMEGFEPVFEREGNAQHIDIRDKNVRGAPTVEKDDLAERVAAALSNELKAVMEEVIKKKVPQLVREEMERLKKE
jgi:CheY-like chemotaxis protein